MSTAAYKQKAQAKLDEQKAAIDSARAKMKGMTADARLEAEGKVSALEKHYEKAKKKMADLAEAGEDAWEDFTDGLEEAWDSVAAGVKKLFS